MAVVFVAPKRSVQRVFIHCSASDNVMDDDVSIIRRWHLARGFNDIGYHYFIKKSGKIQPGRNLELTPAAQKDNNLATIAICLHGLNKDKFTNEQFASLKELVSAINTAYKGKVTFHGHCEVNKNKTCPVFDYKRVLNLDYKGYYESGKKVY